MGRPQSGRHTVPHRKSELQFADPDIVLLTLDAPSAYLPVLDLASGPRCAEQTTEFLEALAKKADHWSALEAVHFLTPGFRSTPDPERLESAEAVLQAGGSQFKTRLRERVTAVGGNLSSGPTVTGFRVTVRLPCLTVSVQTVSSSRDGGEM